MTFTIVPTPPGQDLIVSQCKTGVVEFTPVVVNADGTVTPGAANAEWSYGDINGGDPISADQLTPLPEQAST